MQTRCTSVYRIYNEAVRKLANPPRQFLACVCETLGFLGESTSAIDFFTANRMFDPDNAAGATM
jgi:hypothetical protein